ncbi:MAG TPA: DNA adenine methylase [Candidatus Polarisedimenticolia bacterium]|nr:DNA adenine methylase [Candidatus Polarisedimenticolia bacterium]
MPPARSLETPRPFLKWAGGKTQLLSRLEALFPEAGSFDRYLEPFLGSGAVFFRVQSNCSPRTVLLSDGNEELVLAWRSIQKDVEGVIALLERHRRRHGREHYYRVRARSPESLSPAERAARLIYLNKTCFNGLYRVNAAGIFNVPMGRYDDPPILDAGNLRRVARALCGVRLKGAHFRETLDDARPDDFIYFDPPYDPLSATSSFTSYMNGAFRERDQEELAEVYRVLTDRGCRVMLSNSDTALIRRLYGAFDIRPVKVRRSINSNAARRGPVPEVVVLSYRPPDAAPASPPRRTRGVPDSHEETASWLR